MIPLRALIALSVLLGGCNSYVLKGHVVQGDISIMSFVRPDDPRLADPPVTGARVTVVRDPENLGAERVGSELSDGYGEFWVPLDAFGAGHLDEVFRISVSRSGYQTANSLQRLRASDERVLLVILGSGQPDAAPEGLLDQYERFR